MVYSYAKFPSFAYRIENKLAKFPILAYRIENN